RRPSAARKAAEREAEAKRKARAERQRERLDRRPEGEFAWGAAAIARVLCVDEKAVYNLWATGALDGAVVKFGKAPPEGERDRRSLVGNIAKLRALCGASE